MFEEVLTRIDELTHSGVVAKQRSITQLFPPFFSRVRAVVDKGSLRLRRMDPEVWHFKIHSGTKDGVWYDGYVRFKNLPAMLGRYVKDFRLWTKDGERVDLVKLAREIFYHVDFEWKCSCPAFLYWGSAYVLTQRDAKYTDPENRRPRIRNPREYGAVCKHLQVLLTTFPFYQTTVARWLRDNYGRDIERLENELKREREVMKRRAAELGRRKVEPEEEGPETPPTPPVSGTPPAGPEGTRESKLYESEEVKIGNELTMIVPGFEHKKGKVINVVTRKGLVGTFVVTIVVQLPDGKEVFYAPAQFGKIWKVEPEGTRESKLTEGGDYTPGQSREKTRLNRCLHRMKYKEVPALVGKEEFEEIKVAWSKLKSPLGYVCYDDVAKELNMSVGKLMQYLKGMHQQNPYSVRFNVDRLGNNIYFKLPTERERKEAGESRTNESTFKSRLGQCFRLAGNYVIDHENAILVHGTIHGERFLGKGAPIIDHAWVEEGDEIFDPVSEWRLPKKVWLEIMGAKEEKRYSREEASKEMLRAGKYGPWEKVEDGKNS